MTETTVAYHVEDGEGRPAIRVRDYHAGMDYIVALERLIGPLPESDDDPGRDDFRAVAYDRIRELFWHDAATLAEELGLGPIEQQGRSGGWLILTDGRDPESMEDDHICRCGHWQTEHYAPEANEPGGCEGCFAGKHEDTLHIFALDPEQDTLAEIAGRGGEPSAWPRHAWLEGYRKLRDWCESYIADAPAKVARLAQSLAIDAAGEASVTLRSWLAWGKEYAL